MCISSKLHLRQAFKGLTVYFTDTRLQYQLICQGTFLYLVGVCHTLLFSEWLTVMATHALFSKSLMEESVNWLQLRIYTLAYDSGLHSTNHYGKVFNRFEDTSGEWQGYN